MRQWVLSVPFPLGYLFASRPAVMVKAPRSDELRQLTNTIARLAALYPKPLINLTRLQFEYNPLNLRQIRRPGDTVKW